MIYKENKSIFWWKSFNRNTKRETTPQKTKKIIKYRTDGNEEKTKKILKSCEEKIEKTIEILNKELNDKEKRIELVNMVLEKEKRNKAVRMTRLYRKINLKIWNCFFTFTYDDSKLNEENFRKKLLNSLRHFVSRKSWKYIGVFKRSL